MGRGEAARQKRPQDIEGLGGLMTGLTGLKNLRFEALRVLQVLPQPGSHKQGNGEGKDGGKKQEKGVRWHYQPSVKSRHWRSDRS
jgi:hypothetical protein